MKTKVGIVIIGRNEGARLIECFKSVISAEAPLVYVDSQSSDASVEEAHKYKIETIVLDSSKPLSAARARNEGFNRLVELNSEIEYIHFIDADCELHPNWLNTAISVLEQQNEIALVCGRLREKYRNTSVYMRLCDIDWYRPPGVVAYCGGIATYRRSIFELHNGFDAGLIAGEEPELCARIREKGGQILCIAAEMGTHDSAMNKFSQWWKRCVKVGYGYMSGIGWGGWRKQYKSALFWGLLLPGVVLLLLSYTSGFSLLFFALYPMQVFRVYQGIEGEALTAYDRFIYSFFCVLSKFPETQGLLMYFISKLLNKSKIIQYK
jgi:glycosyltransferase involved in cell wall biosynthesis